MAVFSAAIGRGLLAVAARRAIDEVTNGDATILTLEWGYEYEYMPRRE